MVRTYVITGAASGIGRATVELLRSRGHLVIGVDTHDTDINVDLAAESGREELASEAASLSGGTVDGIVAAAGVSAKEPRTVGVNFFGALATLRDLRPLLQRSTAPRAVAVTSFVALNAVDNLLMKLMAHGDEAGALARTTELAASDAGAGLIYPSSKRALAQWIRREAPTEAWAGSHIALNAIAPGVIITPMSAHKLETLEGRMKLISEVPMPLNGFAEAIVPARLLAWLISEENSHLCGQVVFIDGGSDAVTRGDSTW